MRARVKLISDKPQGFIYQLLAADSWLVRNSSKSGDFIQRLKYEDDDLIISLSNTMKFHDYDVAKSKTFVGRMIGKIVGSKDLLWLKVDGARLYQLFKLANVSSEVKIQTSRQYMVHVDDLRIVLQSDLVTTNSDNLI